MGLLSYFTCCPCCYVQTDQGKPLPNISKIDVTDDNKIYLPLDAVHHPDKECLQLVLIADVHNLQSELKMPKGDILLVAGDISI